MYRTIKIRLHATKEQKEHLLAYEEVYHTDLQDLIHQLHKHPSSIRYADLCFSDAIEVHSRWLLYQTALKMFNRQLAHKKTSYWKSRTWGPRSFQIKSSRLTLHYGRQFSHRKDTLLMKPLSQELLSLQEHTIIRMDLVHDEFFWYANFLIRIAANT